jgi:dihydropteroate synthase
MSTYPPPVGPAPFVLPPLQHPVRNFGGRSFDFSQSVALMAIINRTPDSFYDDGRTFALDAAVSAAMRAVADGADWVDVGGVPFAPGPEVGAREEADRVVPVVAALAARSDVVISVDTFRPEVAELSIAAGASVINDTTGLSNPELASVVAEGGAHLVLTHSRAAPRTVFPRPQYDDVVLDVVRFLAARTELASQHGLPVERLLIDPGHDLNKNTLHSLELTRRFAEVAALGLPALAAVSNKDFIGETLRQEKKDRLAGSLAAAVVCILGGARVVRMHNVAEAHAAIRFTEAVMGWREPAYLRHNMGDENAPAAR